MSDILHIYPSVYQFPNPLEADPQQEGLVAMGADLAPSTLLEAYKHGIFPWFNQNEPICWWSPDPRCIIYPSNFKPSKSLKQSLKKNNYHLSINRAFTQVMQGCAAQRAYSNTTWIHPELIDSYTQLHLAGFAYSIEVWEQTELVGGLYGIQLGGAFFGESMFSRRTDVSKMAFYLLMLLGVASNFPWVDCQLPNPHLLSLGAVTLPRHEFIPLLDQAVNALQPCWKQLSSLSFLAAQLIESEAVIALLRQNIG